MGAAKQQQFTFLAISLGFAPPIKTGDGNSFRIEAIALGNYVTSLQPVKLSPRNYTIHPLIIAGNGTDRHDPNGFHVLVSTTGAFILVKATPEEIAGFKAADALTPAPA